MSVKLRFFNYKPGINLDATFELRTYEEVAVFHTGTLITTNNNSETKEYCIEFDIPKNLLNAGNFYFKLIFGENQRIPLYTISNIIGFEVENIKLGKNMELLPGVIRPELDFKIIS